MDERAVILQSKCREPEGEVVRSVRLGELSFDRLRFLWDKLSKFEVLFNDHVKGDYKAFINHFIVQVDGEPAAAGLIWDVDDVGIFIMNDIIPTISAQVHFVFWDERFRGREQLCRDMLKLVFDEFKFRRLEVNVPLYAGHTMVAVERIGFVREGRKRKAVLYKDEWFDINLYAILPEDLINIKPFDSKNSVKSTCFSCGNVYAKNITPKPRSAAHGS